MARWRLKAKHYLMVPGTQWEYKETNRDTGRTARKLFDIPRFLDPDDAADYNYPGEIIVCNPGKGQPRDIEFIGPPTPDMEPLDDEARALTDHMEPQWANSFLDSLQRRDDEDFSQSLLTALERKIESSMKGQQAPAQTLSGVSQEDFAQLQKQVAELMARNMELEKNQRRRV